MAYLTMMIVFYITCRLFGKQLTQQRTLATKVSTFTENVGVIFMKMKCNTF